MRDSGIPSNLTDAEERASRALDAAIRCVGIGGRAAAWLTTPNVLLDWDVPLAVARTSGEGCQLVCDILSVMAGLAKRAEVTAERAAVG